MGALIPIEVQFAAQTLGLDAATGDVVRALQHHGIASVLLKGPATAFRLYAEDTSSRYYTDIDLLVSPGSFEAAERVLADLGYWCPLEEMSAREMAWMMETEWMRPGSPPTMVDLHRGFHGVDDWDAWWQVMDRHTGFCMVGGRAVRIPDEAGCALVTSLHDAAVGRDAKSSEDLGRALAGFDRDVWTEAARRASAVDALGSFALGLSHHEAGRSLAQALHLPRHIPVDVATRAEAGPDADPLQLGRAWVLTHRLRRAQGWRERGIAVGGLVFPSAGSLRTSRALARRGWVGLTIVRLLRPFELAVHAPGVLRQVWRGLRRSRRSQESA